MMNMLLLDMKRKVLERVFVRKFSRFLFLGMLCSLWTGMPALAAMPVQQWMTANGAKVLFVETHAIPILDISVEFDAGSRRDPEGKSGLAALTNGSLDKGILPVYGDRVKEAQILDTFADAGALRSNKVSMDRAGYTLRVLSDQAESEKAIRLMSRLLAAPSFPEELLERDKSRLVASIKEEMTRPEAIAGKTFKRDIYNDHPYGRSPTPESVASVSRNDLVSFHKTHYVANRAVISIVGDIDVKHAKEIATEISSKLPVSNRELPLLPDVTRVSATTETVSHPATQAHVLLGMPAVKRGDPDFFALTVGNYILGGGGFSSRLMQEVREKRGLSYSVYSRFQPMIQEGPFIVGLQTEKKQVDDALKVVNSTLNTFLQEGPTAVELQAAKDHLVNSFVMQMDNNRKVLELISMIGYYSLPLDYLDTWITNVKQVSAEDVKAALRRKLAMDKMVTVVVGN